MAKIVYNSLLLAIRSLSCLDYIIYNIKNNEKIVRLDPWIDIIK